MSISQGEVLQFGKTDENRERLLHYGRGLPQFLFLQHELGPGFEVVIHPTTAALHAPHAPTGQSQLAAEQPFLR
ncbi:unnamed protein product [Didymodactylos carnosus]|uniref:Uncharacterized protein n=1 Tax=Didymodactylos carnosus TaxID=1234261 RepID=A0A8S2S560_9BILA|nr:unnamed protein product [Didymodactylos carnosus]CAF4184249.1 unnamed protein product [Didymodactylos carnosus]